MRSNSSARFGNPVRVSCSAWWRNSEVRRASSVTSRAVITHPATSGVSTWLTTVIEIVRCVSSPVSISSPSHVARSPALRPSTTATKSRMPGRCLVITSSNVMPVQRSAATPVIFSTDDET